MAQLIGVNERGAGFIEHNGDYYETQHESTCAQVGDIAQSIVDNRWLPQGTFYPVIMDYDGDVGVFDLDGDFTFVGSDEFTLFRKVVSTAVSLEHKRTQLATLTAEIAELEAQLAEESRLKVGDYARVTDGSIVQITDINEGYSHQYRGAAVNVNFPWFSKDRLTKITPEEARASLIAKIDAHFGGQEAK